MNVVDAHDSDGSDSNFSDNSSWSEVISDDEIDFDVAANVAMHPPPSTTADPIVSKKIKSQPMVHPSHKRTVGKASLRQTNSNQSQPRTLNASNWSQNRNRCASPIKGPKRIITSSPPRSPGGLKRLTKTITSSPPRSPGGLRGRQTVRSVSPTGPTISGSRNSVRVQTPPQSTIKKPKRLSPPNKARLSREDVTPIHFTTRIKEVSSVPKSKSTPDSLNKTNKLKYKTASPTKRPIVVIHGPSHKISGGPAAPALTPKIGSKKSNRSRSPKKHVRSQSNDVPTNILCESPPEKGVHRRNVSMPLDVLIPDDDIFEETDMVEDEFPKFVATTRSKPRSKSLDRDPSAISAISVISDLTWSPDQKIQSRKRSSTGGSNKVKPLPSRANNNKGGPTKSKKRNSPPKPAKKPIRKSSEHSQTKPVMKPTHNRAKSMPTELLTPEEMVETVESEDENEEIQQVKEPARIRSHSLDREPSAMTLFPAQFSQMPKRASTGTKPLSPLKGADKKVSRPHSTSPFKRRTSPLGSSRQAPNQSEKPNTSPKPKAERSHSTPPMERGSRKSKNRQAFKDRPKPSILYLGAGTAVSPKPPLKPTSLPAPKSPKISNPPEPSVSTKAVFATAESASGKRKNTSISPPRSTGPLDGKAPDVPIGDTGSAKPSPVRGRTKSGGAIRSKSPRKNSPKRKSPVPVERRSISPGPHARAMTMSGVEVETGELDGAYVYHERVLEKSQGEPARYRYQVRTRQWSRRDRLIEFKQGSVCFGNREISVVTPPKSLVVIWVVIGIELALDLVATAISFVAFLRDPPVCCEEEVQLDSLQLGITIPFILLIIAEIGFLLRAIFLTLWPKSTYTLDGEVVITDEEVAADQGIGKKLCCLNWSPKSVFWTVSVLTIINPFFGFLITWILLYLSDKTEALAVMGIESATILLHFIALHLEKSAPTIKLKCMHMLTIVAWVGTIAVSLLYLQQGGVCYNSKVRNFWLDGCEVCPDGSVPINDNGLQCPYTTVIRGRNVTAYGPVFGLTLKHKTICEEDLQMCWYTY